MTAKKIQLYRKVALLQVFVPVMNQCLCKCLSFCGCDNDCVVPVEISISTLAAAATITSPVVTTTPPPLMIPMTATPMPILAAVPRPVLSMEMLDGLTMTWTRLSGVSRSDTVSRTKTGPSKLVMY